MFGRKKKSKDNVMHMEYSYKSGFKVIMGMFIAFVIVFGLCNGFVFALEKYTNYRVVNFGIYKFADSEEVRFNEIQKRFGLICPEGEEASFVVDVETENAKYSLGTFQLDNQKRKVALGKKGMVEESVEALYYLPSNWVTTEDKEIVSYKELEKNPVRKTVRGDPTYYRGEDYPDTIPFDEIELTVDAVYFYTDTNQTGYNFIFRVMNKDENFNIKSMDLNYNSACELNPKPEVW